MRCPHCSKLRSPDLCDDSAWYLGISIWDHYILTVGRHKHKQTKRDRNSLWTIKEKMRFRKFFINSDKEINKGVKLLDLYLSNTKCSIWLALCIWRQLFVESLSSPVHVSCFIQSVLGFCLGLFPLIPPVRQTLHGQPESFPWPVVSDQWEGGMCAALSQSDAWVTYLWHPTARVR